MEIFIANLHSDIEEELLSKLFEPFGPVTSVVLVRDKETRLSKCYGFVIMDSAIDAQRAIDDLNGRELAGKILSVKKSTPKDQRVSHKKPGDFVSVSFNKEGISTQTVTDDEYEEPKEMEEVSVKVIDEAEFTTTSLENGLIKINFKN